MRSFTRMQKLRPLLYCVYSFGISNPFLSTLEPTGIDLNRSHACNILLRGSRDTNPTTDTLKGIWHFMKCWQSSDVLINKTWHFIRAVSSDSRKQNSPWTNIILSLHRSRSSTQGNFIVPLERVHQHPHSRYARHARLFN